MAETLIKGAYRKAYTKLITLEKEEAYNVVRMVINKIYTNAIEQPQSHELFRSRGTDSAETSNEEAISDAENGFMYHDEDQDEDDFTIDDYRKKWETRVQHESDVSTDDHSGERSSDDNE